MTDYKNRMLKEVLDEVIAELESWDIEPTLENIKQELNLWITNLYSHIGREAHEHELACGIIDETGMTWEDQDTQMLKQINEYRTALAELG